MKVENLKTMLGMPLTSAMATLDIQLPPEAYAPVSGGRGKAMGLTDIKPAFLYEHLTTTFGPIGLGWGYRLVSMQSEMSEDNWIANCRLVAYYAALNGDERIVVEFAEAPGSSDNSEREWAEKGAITNALKCAWSFAGWQSSVYKGIRSHNAPIGAPEPPKPSGPPREKPIIQPGRGLTATKITKPTVGTPTERKSFYERMEALLEEHKNVFGHDKYFVQLLGTVGVESYTKIVNRAIQEGVYKDGIEFMNRCRDKIDSLSGKFRGTLRDLTEEQRAEAIRYADTWDSLLAVKEG